MPRSPLITPLRVVSLALLPLAALVAGACSSEHGEDPGASASAVASRGAIPTGVDTSRSTVQRGPAVQVSHAESSPAVRDIPAPRRADDSDEEDDHPVRRLRPLARHALPLVDPILQAEVPLVSMPGQIANFLSQGNTDDSATLGGTPPDTNGAVGPNDYVQAVNTALAVWDKSGSVLKASASMVGIWAGYVGTNAGNGCATRDDGDPVVVYDQLADRWLVTQFSLPNANASAGPNFQCVAVSKTSDPTGSYWLYDFSLPGFNDYGKAGIWPDAYYATFNMFTDTLNGDSDFCAWDRASMLAGSPAQQQCFQQGDAVSGALPVSLDGRVPPPVGEPGFFLDLNQDSTSLDLFKLHVDWAVPANSTLTGPTNLTVTPYQAMCNAAGGTCVPQPSPGNQLDALSDRLMFRLAYRNYGTYETLVVNHAVDITGAAGGVRWYEIRNPAATPSVYQQGTYAPADGNYRWMASLAQDQAESFLLGFSISSATKFPSIGWTGRLATDAVNTMGQGEAIIDTGKGVETGNFASGPVASRWGDYSNVTVDPTDDCTFYYTQELYDVTGMTPRTWDTYVASVKFPNCAANDFTIDVAPSTRTISPGGVAAYTVTTAAAKGTAEPVQLVVEDLPTGVGGAFVPATVTAGSSSTLTLTATAGASLTAAPVQFMVIGKAPSAVHKTNALVTLGAATADAGTDSGAGVDSGMGGGTDSGSGEDSGGAADSGSVSDSGSAADSATGHDAGGGLDSSVATDSAAPPVDSSAPATDSGSPAEEDSGSSASEDAGSPGGGATGNSGGCGCHTTGGGGGAPWQVALAAVLVAAGGMRRRRSRVRASSLR